MHGFRLKTWRCAWDGKDRLIGCETPSGGKWRYGYDPFGRRVFKRRDLGEDEKKFFGAALSGFGRGCGLCRLGGEDIGERPFLGCDDGALNSRFSSRPLVLGLAPHGFARIVRYSAVSNPVKDAASPSGRRRSPPGGRRGDFASKQNCRRRHSFNFVIVVMRAGARAETRGEVNRERRSLPTPQNRGFPPGRSGRAKCCDASLRAVRQAWRTARPSPIRDHRLD